jgi:hypothetical protein
MTRMRVIGSRCVWVAIVAVSMCPQCAIGQAPNPSALWVMPRGKRSVETTFPRVAEYAIVNCRGVVTAECIENNIVLGLLGPQSTTALGKAVTVTIRHGVTEKQRPVDEASNSQGHRYFVIKLIESDHASPIDTLAVSLVLRGKRQAALNSVVFCRTKVTSGHDSLPLCTAP